MEGVTLDEGVRPGETLDQALDPDLRNSLIAMRRAAQMARETAVRTGTAIIVLRDGRMTRVTSEELKAEGVR